MDIRDLFPREVRGRAAARVFDRPVRDLDGSPVGYACAEGYCIVGALLHEAGVPTMLGRPGPSAAWATLYGRFPDYGDDRFVILSDLMWHNDQGEYADSAAVRAALVPEEVAP